MNYLKIFAEDVRENFNLDRFNLADRSPLLMAKIKKPSVPINHRVNHYLVHQPNEAYYLGELDDCQLVKDILNSALYEAASAGIFGLFDRYVYITVDTKTVEKGKTQRESGWHVDGLQGDEVYHKMPGDLSFIWCDSLPTEFAVQKFNVDGLDLSKHNIFKALSEQVQEENIYKARPECLYMFNAYTVHRSAVAEQETERTFIRIGFTHTPITSTRMTINPQMNYNYQIHTTSGEIPNHLI